MKTVPSPKPSFLLWALLFQLCIQTSAFSQSVINYQGRVVSGGTVFTGTGQFRFALVSKDGSKVFWKNDGSNTDSPPTAAIALPVTKGLFAVQLGDSDIANMAAIPSVALSNPGLKLRVWFNDGLKGWQQFAPDQPVNLQNSANTTTGSESSNGTTTKPGTIITSVDLAVPSASLLSVGKGDWVEFTMDFGVMSSVRNPLITSDGRHFYVIGGFEPPQPGYGPTIPLSKVYRYDPRDSQVSVVSEISGLYRKPNTAPLGYRNDYTSAIQHGFKWSLIDKKIYVAAGNELEEGYYRQLFGFLDTATAGWTDLEDLTGLAAASMSSGSMAKLSDGFVYLITEKRTSTYGAYNYFNSFKKYSEGTGWIQSGTIPESSKTDADYSPLTGGGFFKNDTLFWFGVLNAKAILISQNVFNAEKRRANLNVVSPGAILPSFNGQSYGGRLTFLDISDVREVEGSFFLLNGARLYQVDVNNSTAADKTLFPIGPGESSKGFIVGCDGRLYVFLKTLSDGTAWQGYSASLSSLRNVFIRN